MKKNNAVIKFRTLTGNADLIRLKNRTCPNWVRTRQRLRSTREKTNFESTVALWKV